MLKLSFDLDVLTDEEIVKRITQQLGIIVTLTLIARLTDRLNPTNTSKITHLRRTAETFTVHVLKLTYTHREAVGRWMRVQEEQMKKFRSSAVINSPANNSA